MKALGYKKTLVYIMKLIQQLVLMPVVSRIINMI
jgi:hypothetical protein